MLPGIVEQMMKPAEKIESIRINHITGIGAGSVAKGIGSAGNDGNAVNQVIDGMLKLALQLPAVKKLGEEVGLNVGGGVRGLSASLEWRTRRRDERRGNLPAKRDDRARCQAHLSPQIDNPTEKKP